MVTFASSKRTGKKEMCECGNVYSLFHLGFPAEAHVLVDRQE